jgi:hypothetical protein
MTNNKQQTAVEWQFEQLFNSFEKFNNGEYTFDEFLSTNLRIREQAKEMEVMGREMSYSDGYSEGYKRALELTQWTISNLIPPHNESNP